MITFFVALIAILGVCLLLAKPFLYTFAWSSILTVIAYPLYKRLQKTITNSSFRAFVTLAITVILVLIPLIFTFAYALKEGITFLNYLSEHTGEVKLKNYTAGLISLPIVGNLYKFLAGYINFSEINIQLILKEKLEFIAGILVHKSLNLIQDTVTGSIKFIITLITFYFLLRDFPKLLNLLKTFIPLDENQTLTLFNKVGETIYTTVYVALFVAIIQGTLGGLAFWLLDLKSPVLWGIVMAVFCLIPLLGHPVVWVPAAVFLALKGLYLKAIILVLFGMFVIGLIDNVIRTIFIGAKTQLHPLIVFFSVLGGVLLVGPIGLLLGPITVVITFFLLEVLKLKLSAQS